MPDVKVYLNDGALNNDAQRLREQLPAVVARQMSCLVPMADEPSGTWEYYWLGPGEIDLFVIFCGPGSGVLLNSNAAAIVEVSAYAFPDRMATIGQRMDQIGLAVKELLGLGDDQKVSYTFNEVKDGLWGIV